MKLPPFPTARAQERGSVMLITMIMVLTVAAIAASYLLMVQNSNQLISRSQHWDQSLTLAESGVEEAMAGLNSSYGFTGPVNRSLPTGSYGMAYYYYAVTNQYVLSTGAVVQPLTSDTITRRVKVYVSPRSLALLAVGTILNINMNGNGVSVDSFNSFDPSQSNNGLYDGYVGTNASVASVEGAVNIGNHTIDGNLYLGPTATYNSGSSQVTGNIYTDWNIEFPDPTLPTRDSSGNPVVWTPAPVSSSGGTTVHNFTAGGYYQVNDSYPIQVAAGVTVNLDVQPITWSPTSITINGGTTNAGTAIMYLESTSVTLSGSGNGGAVNNRAANLEILGMASTSSITLSGNSSFVGVIYAPEATLTLSGGGNNNNLIGSFTVKSLTINGHYNIHYDSSLGTNSLTSGYIATGWQEF